MYLSNFLTENTSEGKPNTPSLRLWLRRRASDHLITTEVGRAAGVKAAGIKNKSYGLEVRIPKFREQKIKPLHPFFKSEYNKPKQREELIPTIRHKTITKYILGHITIL